MTNTTSDEVLRNRTCPDGAPCTSRAMEISDGNQQLTARFCAVTVDNCLRGKERGPCNSGERREGGRPNGRGEGRNGEPREGGAGENRPPRPIGGPRGGTRGRKQRN